MPMTVKVDHSGLTPKTPQRQINNATRTGYQMLGEHFFETNLPRRFTYAGGKMLAFQPRTAKYNKRKKAKNGNIAPLVWSGESKQRVLSELTKIKATATRSKSKVELTLNAPALNFRRTPTAPNLRDEITRVAKRELPPLERVLEKDLDEQYNKLAGNN